MAWLRDGFSHPLQSVTRQTKAALSLNCRGPYILVGVLNQLCQCGEDCLYALTLIVGLLVDADGLQRVGHSRSNQWIGVLGNTRDAGKRLWSHL